MTEETKVASKADATNDALQEILNITINRASRLLEPAKSLAFDFSQQALILFAANSSTQKVPGEDDGFELQSPSLVSNLANDPPEGGSIQSKHPSNGD